VVDSERRLLHTSGHSCHDDTRREIECMLALGLVSDYPKLRFKLVLMKMSRVLYLHLLEEISLSVDTT